MNTKFLPLLFLIPLLFTGCSSIVDGGSNSHVQINSNPTGAKLSIYNKDGKAISVQTTPANLTLKRNHGYFAGEDYKMILEATNCYPYEVHVKSTVDGWYFGNFIFGGLIGLLIVDPATGAMYTLKPEEVTINLISSAVPLTADELKSAELKANPPPEIKHVNSKSGGKSSP
jgi:hypothetical protein